jgi:hypothetical protein
VIGNAPPKKINHRRVFTRAVGEARIPVPFQAPGLKIPYSNPRLKKTAGKGFPTGALHGKQTRPHENATRLSLKQIYMIKNPVLTLVL